MTERRAGVRVEDDVRTRCYANIRSCVTEELAKYYLDHPERLLDERSLQKLQVIRTILVCILGILEKYEIKAR